MRKLTSRRSLLGLTVAGLGGLGVAGFGLSGCSVDTGAEPTLDLSVPLPEEIPAGTTIVIGDPASRVALELSGQLQTLPFVQWANLSGGPQTSEAFRAGALDAGAGAEIPPLHARWTGLRTKIIASRFRIDPLDHPSYEFGVAPGLSVTALADFRGHSIAFSPGQAQGALVLKTLAQAGLTRNDVELIELPSTGDVYAAALAAREIDIAPIGGVQIRRYRDKYGADGARTIRHGIRDDPWHLYAPESSLADPGKAAAFRALVQAWARASRWIDEHPDEWIEGYYVKDQGLTATDGQWLVDRTGLTEVPPDLTEVYARHQETIELLSGETGNESFRAEELYDPRFVPIAAEAFAAVAST